MKIERAAEEINEQTIMLKNTTPGDCIRFAHDSFEDALKCDLFWLRIDSPELKERIRLVNFSSGKQIERDGDHRVITHVSKLRISA